MKSEPLYYVLVLETTIFFLNSSSSKREQNSVISSTVSNGLGRISSSNSLSFTPLVALDRTRKIDNVSSCFSIRVSSLVRTDLWKPRINTKKIFKTCASIQLMKVHEFNGKNIFMR